MQDWATTVSEAASFVGLLITLYFLAFAEGSKRRKGAAIFFVFATVAVFWMFSRVHGRSAAGLRAPVAEDVDTPVAPPSSREERLQTSVEAFADFSMPDVEAINMRVTPGPAFAFNGVFGGSWRVTAPGGGFTAVVVLPKDARYDLVITHLTSMDANCPGRGYSPITIQFDSEMIVANYDPSASHAATHGMVTDQWPVMGRSGQNTLRLATGALCTHYWIRRVEFRSTNASDN